MINYLATSAEKRSSLVRCGTMLEDIYFVVFEEWKIQGLGIFGGKKQRERFQRMKEIQKIWEKLLVDSVDEMASSQVFWRKNVEILSRSLSH